MLPIRITFAGCSTSSVMWRSSSSLGASRLLPAPAAADAGRHACPTGWPSGPTMTMSLLGRRSRSCAQPRRQAVSTILPTWLAVLHEPVGLGGLGRGAAWCVRRGAPGRPRPAATRARRPRRRSPPSPPPAGPAATVAMTAPRLRSSVPRSSSPLVPPCMPMTTSRPSVARASTLRSRYFAPMLSRMTSAPPASREHLDEVLVAVVDRHVGAEVGADRELLGRCPRW